MIKPLIVLDIDGVLADFMWAVYKRWGKPKIPVVYDLTKQYPDRSQEDVRGLIEDVSLYTNLPLVLGAKKAVKWLHESGFILKAVTGRPDVDGMEDVTRRWVKKHFKGMISEVHLVPAELKALLTTDMLPAFVIDDSPDVVRAATALNIRAVLFTQIYNSLEKDIPRALSWADFLNKLKRVVRQ